MKYFHTLLILLLTAFSVNSAFSQQAMGRVLSLSEAIETGLKNNPEIKTAEENIKASTGRFWSSISLPAPEVSLTYEYTPLNSSLSNFGERTFEVSQSFEFPSNYFLKGTLYNKEEEAAAYALKKAQLKVASQVKAAYYNALAKEELLKRAEENLVIEEDFSKKAEIRFNVGEASPLERLTAKVKLTEAKNDVEIARNEVKIGYAELSLALGYGYQSDESFSLTDSLQFNRHADLSFNELYNLALSANYDLKLSELNRERTSIDKGLAWSSLLPTFNLTYFRQTVGGHNGFYGASFGFSVPVWFLFENRGKIQEANANENIAESGLLASKNELYFTLKNAYNNFQNSIKQVELYLDDILPQSEEVARTASASYEAGEITYLEYLQAMQTLITARTNYISLLLNFNISKTTLEQTTGINPAGGEIK